MTIYIFCVAQGTTLLAEVVLEQKMQSLIPC